MKAQRILYIDNLRIFLTLLVVAHHWAIGNGAPGDTYYNEANLGPVESLLMSIFVATNQAFFMGFFFFISGYFVPSSYKKKGGSAFIKERLIRLGIPMVFYAFVLSPILIIWSKTLSGTFTGSYWDFIRTGEGFSLGPMWFVALLLLFSILYFWFDKMTIGNLSHFYRPIKKPVLITGFFTLILVTFLLRIYFPVGDWLPVIGIQPAHLTQYVICFALGIWTKETNTLRKLKFKSAIKWFVLAQILILIGFPMVFLLGGAPKNTDLFMGGLHWQSLAYVVWEQLVAVSMIYGFLGIFNRYFNKQNDWTKDLSQNTYAIYVFHGIVLIAFSAMFQFYQGNSLGKFIVLLIPVLLFCYLLAKFVRNIPFVQKVL